MITLLLDLSFISGWIGLATVVIWMVSSFLYGLNTARISRYPLTGIGITIFWCTVALWVGLSVLAFVYCYGTPRFDDFRSNLWTRILVIQFFLVIGPTAYYIGFLRPNILQRASTKDSLSLKRSRRLLDLLYFLSFWGSIAFVFTIGALLIFANAVESIVFFGTVSLVLLPLAVISTMIMEVILLVDAVARPEEQWRQVDFLKLLNPWSWIFGMRKYYLHVLRPEIA
jgi:hypothetical protein